jgi:hypothetical protein
MQEMREGGHPMTPAQPALDAMMEAADHLAHTHEQAEARDPIKGRAKRHRAIHTTLRALAAEVRAQRETIAGLEARVEALTARDERAVLAMQRMQAAMMRQHLTSHDYETLRGTSQAIAVGLREFLDAHAPREIALAISGDAPND